MARFPRCVPSAFALFLVGSPASALTIDVSNVYRYSAVVVIHHEAGASYSYFVVEDYGGDSNSVDLGYASASASATFGSLHAASYVDGSQIAPLGLNYAIAEASARYDANVVFGGGRGSFELRMSAVLQTDHGSTGGATFIGGYGWGIEALAGPVTFVINPDGSLTYTLEYGVPYRLRTFLTAYSRATLGHETWRTRTLSTYFSVVPEPGAGILVGGGLLLVGLWSRGRSSPERRASEIRRSA